MFITTSDVIITISDIVRQVKYFNVKFFLFFTRVSAGVFPPNLSKQKSGLLIDRIFEFTLFFPILAVQ